MENRDSKGRFFKGCSQPHTKPKWNKVCPFCNITFQVRYSLKRIKFCSRSCATKSRPPMHLGIKHSNETKLKMRKAKLGIRGSAHWNWRGGNRTERQIAMKRDEYIQWRKSIFTRDNFTCQICKKYNGYLEADHIKPWALYPELRYDISNGRTLCRPCHITTPTWGGRSKGAIYE